MKVRVAVVDSGINSDHPHVGQVMGGIFFHKEIASEDFVDRLGHGTAVSAVIHEKAPAAEIYAVRIFNRRLSTDIDTLMRGLDWCLANKMHVVNLSIGTSNQHHRPRLEDFLRRARAQDVFVVSAANMLPGMLDGAIGVDADPDCDRDAILFQNGAYLASPYPRSIPGVPKELNLHGISFAIANCTGVLANVLELHPPVDAYREFCARAGRP
jgi:subtilisin family serine protease